MKKLMIAATIVCAAVVSQAANVVWYWNGTLNNGYLNSGASSTTYEGKAGQACTVYFINAAAHTQSDVLDAIVNGTSTLADFAVNAGTETAANGYYTTADGTMPSANKKLIADHTAFGPKDANGKGIGFLATIVTYDGTDYLFLSANNTAATISTTAESKLTPSPGTASSYYQGIATEGGYTSAGWYAMAVPEPTSGLLLLVGVAGLALRRRRA